MAKPHQTKAPKRILITGCSTGIGLETAKHLHHKGHHVIASARKQSNVDTLKSLGLEAVQLDMDSSESINSCVAYLQSKHQGKIDALFNNAGFGQPGAVEDLTREAIREQFETNVFGLMELTNKIIPLMRKQGQGWIIQNSSVLGFVPFAFRGAYNASKFALEGLTDTLRVELRNSPIRISTIQPGPIESEFRNNAYQHYLKHIQPEHSTHQALYRLYSKRFTQSGKKDPFTLKGLAVAKCVEKIINSQNPKPKYRITLPTHFFAVLKRLMTTRAFDRVCYRVLQSEMKS